MATWLEGKIIEKNAWNDRLFSLKIEAPVPEFKAGQFIRVALEIDGEIIARPYSLVNSPGEPFIEILFNIVPAGPLTPRLALLQAGDNILVAEKANGFLTLDELPESDDLWMLATGTGVGPFVSILKTSELWQRYKNIVLVYSVREEQELAYVSLIQSVQNTHSEQFRYIRCITRETVAGAFSVRIPEALKSGLLAKKAGQEISIENSHIMMCGNSGMITEVTELLEARGLRKHRRREPGHITTEKYH